MLLRSKKFKEIPQAVWQDKLARGSFLVAAFFWLSGLSVLIFLSFRLPPQVPLFYSQPWGEEQLASAGLLFLLPAVAFLILLINFLASVFLAEEKLILRILAVSSALGTFLVFFTLMRILALAVK